MPTWRGRVFVMYRRAPCAPCSPGCVLLKCDSSHYLNLIVDLFLWGKLEKKSVIFYSLQTPYWFLKFGAHSHIRVVPWVFYK